MTCGTAANTIAIVGGGALGVALLDRLVDRLSAESSRGGTRIVLFEKAARVGPGLAYARDASPHLLNQSAQTMSLVPGRRAHFCDWLDARAIARPDGDLFCARELFGDYLEECFERAVERAARSEIGVSRIRDEVSSVRRRPLGGYRVVGQQGSVDADVVLLAIGNLPGTRFREVGGPGLVRSPYPSAAMCACIARGSRVAIVGTGPSAIDAALALFSAGHAGPVTMTSRGGMLPAVRGPLPPIELHVVTRQNVALATDHGRLPLRLDTILDWLARELARHDLSVDWDRDFPACGDPLDRLSTQVAAAERGARTWQAIGEALNPMIEVLWHHLAAEDRRLFVERFHSRFMSHWVPIPLVTGRRVLGLLREGRLTVARGFAGVTYDETTREYRACLPDGIASFDAIVDATGVPRHLSDCDSALVHSLLA
ncbi:MAG TPA: FAD/NAD(P)-binding protein, partial [Polyangiaceae bacterium]